MLASSLPSKSVTRIIHCMIAGRGPRPGNARLVMGSVKSNIGHTEGGAGACSVAKSALALYHKQIPGSLHLKKLHPEIPLDDYGIEVPQSNIEWPAVRDGMPRRVSINSFGIGGSNTHVVLEEFMCSTGPECTERVDRSPMMLPLSAHNEVALEAWVARWIDYLTHDHQNLIENENNLKVALHSVTHGRSQLDHRICVLGDSVLELRSKLEKVLHKLKGEKYN